MHGTAASVRSSSIDLLDSRKNGTVQYNHKPSLHTYGKIEVFTNDYISTF